jgi:hypothetical protein
MYVLPASRISNYAFCVYGVRTIYAVNSYYFLKQNLTSFSFRIAGSNETLSPLFNFVLKYALTRVQDNQEGLKSNGAHQILACADDVVIVEENIDTIKKNRAALLDASKEIGLEVNQEKTKYMLMSLYQ